MPTATIIINPTFMEVKEKLPPDIIKEVRKRMTYKVPGYMYTRAHKLYGWDGSKCLFSKNQTGAPGCYKRVYGVLKKLGYDVAVKFKNEFCATGEAKVLDLQLSDFQVEAIESAVRNRYGVISAPVRAGKTAIIGGILNRLKLFPAVVITNGKDLVIQTKNDIYNHTGMHIGYFSEGEFVPASIVVTSYAAMLSAFSSVNKKRKNLSKTVISRNKEIKKLVNEAKVLILDECHHVMSEKSSSFMDEFKSIYCKLACSGTPIRDDVTMLESEAAVGPIIYKVKFDDLIDEGRVAKPLIILYDLPYDWYSDHLVEYDSIYINNVVENKYRNKFIADIVNKTKDKTFFIAVNRIDHGQILRNLIPGSFYVRGSISSETRKEIYKSLNDKILKCVIATVGKEGLNIPKLDIVINAEGFTSSVLTIQKMRSLTAHDSKKHGIVIDFMDKGRYIKKHSDSRQDIYSSIKGFEVKIRRVPGDYFNMEESRWK